MKQEFDALVEQPPATPPVWRPTAEELHAFFWSPAAVAYLDAARPAPARVTAASLVEEDRRYVKPLPGPLHGKAIPVDGTYARGLFPGAIIHVEPVRLCRDCLHVVHRANQLGPLCRAPQQRDFADRAGAENFNWASIVRQHDCHGKWWAQR